MASRFLAFHPGTTTLQVGSRDSAWSHVVPAWRAEKDVVKSWLALGPSWSRDFTGLLPACYQGGKILPPGRSILLGLVYFEHKSDTEMLKNQKSALLERIVREVGRLPGFDSIRGQW